MASKYWISRSLSMVYLLHYFQIPNLGCDFICHFKEAHQSQAMRWVKHAALMADRQMRPKF
jgi:hypothetical protein